MAYRPSKRRSTTPGSVEINLFPVMNLMVVIIPLLLSTTTFVKIGIIPINLPPAVEGPISEAGLPGESLPTFDLAVTVTSTGFYLSSPQGIVQNQSGGGPTIPLKEDRTYDFENLGQILYEAKLNIIREMDRLKARMNIEGRSINIGQLRTDQIILQAEMDIPYQVLVNTIDAARSIVIDDEEYTLFPEIIISAGII